MQKVKISDVTLRENYIKKGSNLGFKEKIEIAKKLDKLNIDVIEIAKIENKKTDTLFLHTISPLLTNSILSCQVDLSEQSVEETYNAIKEAKNKRLHLIVPVSSVQMEYMCHKKPAMILELVDTLIKKCASLCDDVEFSAMDATRSEKDFLYKVLETAITAGAKTVTLCDTAGEMLPDEFKTFINDIYANVSNIDKVSVSVECSNKLNMATSCVISSIVSGVSQIKTTIGRGDVPSVKSVVDVIKSKGDFIGASTGIKVTELDRTVSRLMMMLDDKKSAVSADEITEKESGIVFSKDDDIKTVSAIIAKMGYELSDEDITKVFDEVIKLASKKEIGVKEVEAIIASTALQVTPTFKLKSFVINSGNVIKATANITLLKGDEELQGVSIGDGPIDAAFVTIEQITGRHFELDDFQIQSVTEGRDSVGSAIVKLRSDGKLYSGKGVSTDIVGASINAYINAINKIYFEEL